MIRLFVYELFVYYFYLFLGNVSIFLGVFWVFVLLKVIVDGML